MGVDAEHRPLVGPAKFRLRIFECAAREKSGFNPGTGSSLESFPPDYILRIEEATMGKGLLLWLVGVPIPVIILLWLFFGR